MDDVNGTGVCYNVVGTVYENRKTEGTQKRLIKFWCKCKPHLTRIWKLWSKRWKWSEISGQMINLWVRDLQICQTQGQKRISFYDIVDWIEKQKRIFFFTFCRVCWCLVIIIIFISSRISAHFWHVYGVLIIFWGSMGVQKRK